MLPDGGGDIVLGTELTGRDNGGVKLSGTFGAFARIFDRRLRLVLIGLVMLILVSALYFRLIGPRWLESLYLAFTARGTGHHKTALTTSRAASWTWAR